MKKLHYFQTIVFNKLTTLNRFEKDSILIKTYSKLLYNMIIDDIFNINNDFL